ncbi:hypothetical protein ACFW1F_28020 [Streptomyces bungoensis]
MSEQASEQTPSQAEGEREPDDQVPSPPRTTPSQAEGEDFDEDDGGGEGR